MIFEIIGFIGATLTTISFLPQVTKIYKTKSTKDISLAMYIAFALGVACWLTYGIGINSRPVIYANIVTLILVSMVLYMKLKYK
jgi:MtN3 and saliva related transmembrane protein